MKTAFDSAKTCLSWDGKDIVSHASGKGQSHSGGAEQILTEGLSRREGIGRTKRGGSCRAGAQ